MESIHINAVNVTNMYTVEKHCCMVTIVEMFTHKLETIRYIAAIALMLQTRGKTITLLIIVLCFSDNGLPMKYDVNGNTATMPF